MGPWRTGKERISRRDKLVTMKRADALELDS